MKVKKESKISTTSLTGVGFEFNPTGHAYYLDGKKMTGVTTILGVIAKPMLIQWAANQAGDYLIEKFSNSAFPILDRDQVDIWIKEAKVAHRKKKEEAGEKGTDVHAQIEQLIKNQINGVTTWYDIENLNPQVQHFIDWSTQNKVKFLASEEKVFSRELFVAGTIDFICEIDGETWIGDIKTSSAIYPEHFFQTAGYQKLLQDMAETDNGAPLNIKGHVILNCRKDGTFEERRSISNEDNLLAFMSALNIYRVQEKLKGTIL